MPLVKAQVFGAHRWAVEQQEATTFEDAIDHCMREVAYAAGWLFVENLRRGRVQVVKSFPKTLSHEQIAERLRLTTRQVHSRVVSPNKKLRTAR
jgi:hypothetical protein